MSDDLDYLLMASARKEADIGILEASTFVLGLRKMAQDATPIDITGTIEGQFTVPLPEAVSLMAQMVSNEFKTQAHYVYYANMLRGTDRAGIAEEFEDHAKDELEHANYLLRRIGVLSPGGISIPPYPPPKPLYNPQQIVREMIVVEQIGLNLWKQLHSILGDNPMKYTVEQFLQTEEAHQDELWQFLDPMAPAQQMDEAAVMPEAPKTAAEIFAAAARRKTAGKLAAVKQSWGSGGAHLSSDGKTLHFYEGQTGNHGPIEEPWFMGDLPSHMHGGISKTTTPPDESEPRGVHEATFSLPVEEARKHPSLRTHLEQAIADAAADAASEQPAAKPIQRSTPLTPAHGALGGALAGGIGGGAVGGGLAGARGALLGAGLGAAGGGLLGYALNKQAAQSVLSEHSDPPGYMMVSNLKRLADQSKQLSNAVSVEDNAEPWVESKIDRASEAIDAVHDYMKYKSEKKASHALSADEMAAAGWDRSRAGRKEHTVKEAQAAQSMGVPTVPEHDELLRVGMDRRKKAMMHPDDLAAHLAKLRQASAAKRAVTDTPERRLQEARAAARAMLYGSGGEFGMVRTASDNSKEAMDRDKVIKDKARELMAKATAGYRSLADTTHHKDQTRVEIAPVDPAQMQRMTAPFVVKKNPAVTHPQDPENHTPIPMRGPLPMPKQAEDNEEPSHLRRNLLLAGGGALGAVGAGLLAHKHLKGKETELIKNKIDKAMAQVKANYPQALKRPPNDAKYKEFKEIKDKAVGGVRKLTAAGTAGAAALGGAAGAGIGAGISRATEGSKEKKASLGDLVMKSAGLGYFKVADIFTPSPGADNPEAYVMREQQLIAQQAQGEAAHQKAISAQASQAAQQAQAEAQAAQQQLQEMQQQLQEAQQQAEQASQQQTQSAQQAAEAEARAADHSIQKMQLGMRVNQLRQSLANLVMQDPVSENSGTVSDLAATGQPATPQQQQEAEAQQQQAQQAPPSADTQQQQTEAQNAEQNAQVQEQQAEQSAANDQAKMSAFRRTKAAGFADRTARGAGGAVMEGALDAASNRARAFASEHGPLVVGGGLALGGLGALVGQHRNAVLREQRKQDMADAIAEGIRRGGSPQQVSPLTYAQYYRGQE